RPQPLEHFQALPADGVEFGVRQLAGTGHVSFDDELRHGSSPRWSAERPPACARIMSPAQAGSASRFERGRYVSDRVYRQAVHFGCLADGGLVRAFVDAEGAVPVGIDV